MKKQLILLTAASLSLLISLQAGTYRVNNKLEDNPTAKIYSELQEAHDAAYNGDTLMVEGSTSYYNSLNCTKRLVIKGPGYLLDENPGISANKISAKTYSISFGAGSEGSVCMGMDISGGTVSVNEDNITIRRCYLNSLSLWSGYSHENCTVSECYFSLNSSTSIYSYTSAITNLVIVNCIFNGSIDIYSGSTGVFLNNIFNTDQISIPTGFDMKNNILFKEGTENVSLPSMPDPDVAYNISIGNHFGTANNNKANVSESALFLGALTESTDGKWQLAEGSPAKGAGEAGIDCGAFGGPQPYVLSGPPAGPVIYELNVSSYSTADNKLPLTIKVKSY